MGAAALRHLAEMVQDGIPAREALRSMAGSITLDCLRAIVPMAEYEGKQSYLVNRVICVLGALDGEGWSLLTRRETDVALCIRALLRNPYMWDVDEWETRLVAAIEPYRVAAGVSASPWAA